MAHKIVGGTGFEYFEDHHPMWLIQYKECAFNGTG